MASCCNRSQICKYLHGMQGVRSSSLLGSIVEKSIRDSGFGCPYKGLSGRFRVEQAHFWRTFWAHPSRCTQSAPRGIPSYLLTRSPQWTQNLGGRGALWQRQALTPTPLPASKNPLQQLLSAKSWTAIVACHLNPYQWGGVRLERCFQTHHDLLVVLSRQQYWPRRINLQ